MWKKCLTSLIAMNTCGASHTIPLEDFFRTPETVNVQISPNGENIVYGQSWEHRINVFVKNIKSDETKQLTFSTKRDIYDFGWSDDETIIYLQDHNGDENFHLFALSCNGSGVADLTPFDGVRCDIIDKLEHIDGNILIAMNRRNPQFFDVYRLDTRSGEMECVAENPGDVTSWLSDHEGHVRVAVRSDGVNSEIIYRPFAQGEWQTSARYNFKESADPLLFTFDNQQIYVSSNVGRDKQAIFKFDLATGKEQECLFEDADFDIEIPFMSSPLIVSKKNKKILGCAYFTERCKYQICDESFQAMQNDIDSKLAGYNHYITSSNRDETKFIVHAQNDKTPGFYFLFDAYKKKLKKLFDCTPWLKESDMAPMKPISYSSSDGLTIHGYLTLPMSQNAQNLPLIVLPHGGPWSRDCWLFISPVQFLANRGYAVLQVNFRGSTGYGRKFCEAGYKQWGLKMQDDITDGVKWAIDQGIADPKKIAIFGGSYGGYAALCGIAKTPDMYAAAIDYVGVSNLFTWLDAIPPYWESMRAMLYEMVGHPVDDKDQLIATSPIFHVGNIKTPLLIAQGANDPRVKQEQSDQIVESLKKRGVAVEYILKDNEGHGFINEENQFDFYRAMEAFLQKHLN